MISSVGHSVAHRIEKPTSTINDRLALLPLPQNIKELLVQGKILIRAALEVGRISNNNHRESRLAANIDRLTQEVLNSRSEKAILRQPRKRYEKWAAHPLFKELFAGLPVKRVYKDK